MQLWERKGNALHKQPETQPGPLAQAFTFRAFGALAPCFPALPRSPLFAFPFALPLCPLQRSGQQLPWLVPRL